MSTKPEGGVPKFLGIGAAYAGTTWLHQNLKRHPQVWLPPIKELHYFDLFRPGSENYYSLPLWSPDLLRRVLRGRHRATVIKQLLSFRVSFGWAKRYLFGRRDDQWYAGLFPKDRVSGEITPTYLNLPQHVVEAIHQLNPEMKIIILLRDPVQRAWSGIRRRKGMLARMFRGLPRQQMEQKVLEMLNSPAFVDWNNYVPGITTWREVFGEDQVFVGFYDHLKDKPRELLRSVVNFLGLDPRAMPESPSVERVVNAAPKLAFPEQFLPQLYAPYVDLLRELEQLVGGPVSKWRAKAENAVGGKRLQGAS